MLVRSVAGEGVDLVLLEGCARSARELGPAQLGPVGVQHRGLREGDRVPAEGHRQLGRQLAHAGLSEDAHVQLALCTVTPAEMALRSNCTDSL